MLIKTIPSLFLFVLLSFCTKIISLLHARYKYQCTDYGVRCGPCYIWGSRTKISEWGEWGTMLGYCGLGRMMFIEEVEGPGRRVKYWGKCLATMSYYRWGWEGELKGQVHAALWSCRWIEGWMSVCLWCNQSSKLCIRMEEKEETSALWREIVAELNTEDSLELQ